jgi:DNA replication and repair protein RecF
VAARARLVSRLADPFARRLAELGGDPGIEPLRYQPNVAPGTPVATVLRERRGRDVERAVTGAGPHLDDVMLLEHERDLRVYGSQGEQRRALLALLLAEADLLSEERDELPLLLLDDVTGELDASRRALLLSAVEPFQQTIVTTTDRADLGSRGAAVLTVEAGMVAAA